MAKFQSPLLGYNNNVRHKNRVFHIQTEDSGVNHPHIITHLFMDGGRILKSVKKSYAEHVGVDGMSEIVRGMMKEQHKAMFIALRDGQFDALVEPTAGSSQMKAPAKPPATPPSKGDTAARVDAVAGAGAGAAAPADAVAGAGASASAGAGAGAAARADAVAGVAPGAGAGASPAAVAPSAGAVASAAAAVSTAVLAGAQASKPPPLEPATTVPPPTSRVEPTEREPAPPAAVVALGPPPESKRARLVLSESDAPEEIPSTTRQEQAPTSHELTLDFDALERSGHDIPTAASLFQAGELPPPPKNLFAKEPGTGAYRAVEPESRRAPVPPGSSKVPARPTTTGRPSEGRYAPARPAAIFGSAPKAVPAGRTEPPSPSIFSDELISDKSLDEVILSYLAEDLEPPRRK